MKGLKKASKGDDKKAQRKKSDSEEDEEVVKIAKIASKSSNGQK